MGVGESMGESIAASKCSTLAATLLPLTALPRRLTHPFFSPLSFDEMSEARFEAEPMTEALLLDSDRACEERDSERGPRSELPRERSLRALRRKPRRCLPPESRTDGDEGGCE